MLSRVYSAAVLGVDAYLVEIEVNAGGGLPAIIVVGLPDTAVKESKDRVTTAIGNSGYFWPRGRTTVNLAPADVKKEGPSFDLPIALGMIAAHEEIDPQTLEPYCFVGELALTGAVRPVKGVLSIATEARRQGKRALFVPMGNAAEAAVVDGLTVHGVDNLRQTFEAVTGQAPFPPVAKSDLNALFRGAAQVVDLDFADVKGQPHVKRAVEVAVAGGHNLLMIGPPGAGKSMIAKRIPTIMPPLTLEEAIETTKIYSTAGLLGADRPFIGARPFRSPHHTISDAGLLGGSANPSPGEISLAHHGVLFLDELPEFHRSTLEVLRQPLEDGRVTISRAAGSMTFPADFMLIGAMNPCPCGHYGSMKKSCRCSPGQVDRYRKRISGPLLDRIDLHVEAPATEYRDLANGAAEESSSAIRERVEAARMRQLTRQKAPNSRLTSRQLKSFCALDESGAEMLKVAMTELHLSARAYDRILKVSRTIADLAGAESIAPDHLAEAIQYRALDRALFS